jgi:hypothetical protein
MARFWTRTRTFLAVVWLAVVVAELIVFLALGRIDNSVVLLLFAAVLIVPLVAIDMTVRWMRRPPREQWKRYEVTGAATRQVVEPPAELNDETKPGLA